MNLEFSAIITGEPFLYHEIKQVAKLKLHDLPRIEIKKQIKDNNLFQYSTEKSVDKRAICVLKRLEALNSELVEIIANGPIEEAKAINLYSIILTNRLVYEFVSEIIIDKLKTDNLVLEKKDINEFFIAKKEQSERVARWAEGTINKLKQVLIRIFFEARLIENKKNMKLQRLRIKGSIIGNFDSYAAKVFRFLCES